jgi:hypothetical protein
MRIVRVVGVAADPIDVDFSRDGTMLAGSFAGGTARV